MVGIAILGYGVVGSGVYEVIRKNFDGITRRAGTKIDIKHILDIREFNSHPEKELFTINYDDILTDTDVSVVVEVMGGVNPAYEFTKRALMAKKSVVTSNKELVAKHGCELLKLASENKVHYLFEASVGGGIPIIRPLKLCLAANEISEITGILNGTTNYILTQMINKDETMENALKKAQDKGYAEKDPSADIDGIDAVRKIAILTSLAFGKYVDSTKIPVTGIRNVTLTDVEYAKKSGCVIKLCGHCRALENGKLDVYVSPCFVPDESPLASVDGVFNAILVKGNAVGDALFYGRGAGKLPTASAVVSDVIEIAKSGENTDSPVWEDVGGDILENSENSVSKHITRVKADDKESVKAEIEKIFDGVESRDAENGEIGFVTDEMTAKDFENKLNELNKDVISTFLVLS